MPELMTQQLMIYSYGLSNRAYFSLTACDCPIKKVMWSVKFKHVNTLCLF